MKILLIGDVFGKAGRRAVARFVPQLVKEHNIQFVLANGENVTNGKGIQEAQAKELFASGVHFLTGGNHTFNFKGAFGFLDTDARVIRPANIPGPAPGKGYAITHAQNGTRIAVINLMGRVYMNGALDCPFKKADAILTQLEHQADLVLVDFHAEATSEKVALGHYLDGRVTAFFGTHTHIPTADERILPGGTAYMTDLGMTGPYDSVIGVKKEIIIKRYLTGMPAQYEDSKKGAELHGLIVDVDETVGKVHGVQRVRLSMEEQA